MVPDRSKMPDTVTRKCGPPPAGFDRVRVLPVDTPRYAASFANTAICKLSDPVTGHEPSIRFADSSKLLTVAMNALAFGHATSLLSNSRVDDFVAHTGSKMNADRDSPKLPLTLDMSSLCSAASMDAVRPRIAMFRSDGTAWARLRFSADCPSASR